MAKAFSLALPLPQSQNLNQTIHTHFNRKPAIISSSCTRIFSSNSHNSNHINTTYYNSNNVNFVHNRRFPSIFVAPLSSIFHRLIPFCSSCNCHCFPSFSLLPLRRSRLSSFRFVIMSHSGELGSTNHRKATKTIKCSIKGRVQGVFYRNWTIDNAIELGLKGWVRNRRDGSVEALFSGKAEAVDEMLQRCRRGPPHAMVTALDASPSDEDPGTGFERKPTV